MSSKSPTQSGSTEKDKANPFAIAAIGMILALPLSRILEAVLRLAFMRDYYGGIFESLTQDLWFSEGWLNYVKTPLGLSMTLLPLLLLVGIVVSFFLSIRWHRKHMRKKKSCDS